MKVVICGSTNSSLEQISLAAKFFMQKGNLVVTPSSEDESLILKRLNYLNEIETADLVVIIPKRTGFDGDVDSVMYKMGESTCYEYLHAIKQGIPTVIWDHPNYESDMKASILENNSST